MEKQIYWPLDGIFYSCASIEKKTQANFDNSFKPLIKKKRNENIMFGRGFQCGFKTNLSCIYFYTVVNIELALLATNSILIFVSIAVEHRILSFRF